ncbi:hypothetical protein QR680_007803 [Steinernema hermaphroditum]|uniref:Uncharacterized protein n=1 Tax=Steinernema hermaphroditum TaxID=289476 RepID=A0AA39IFV9_9BILA|nr:hypothetical protein QR680_007803 [Steinernema hermaphroditum]
MILATIVLLALSQVGHATFKGKRFLGKDHDMLVAFKVRTADDLLAGSNSNISFSFGYVNELTDKLVYHHESVEFRNGKNHFEKKQLDSFRDMLNGWRYSKVETACAEQSTKAAEYTKCLTHPNIVFINVQNNKLIDLNADWMLDNIIVTITIRSKKGTKVTGTSHFVAENKWIKTKKYYLRSSESSARMPVREGAPFNGKSFP